METKKIIRRLVFRGRNGTIAHSVIANIFQTIFKMRVSCRQRCIFETTKGINSSKDHRFFWLERNGQATACSAGGTSVDDLINRFCPSQKAKETQNRPFEAFQVETDFASMKSQHIVPAFRSFKTSSCFFDNYDVITLQLPKTKKTVSGVGTLLFFKLTVSPNLYKELLFMK